MRDYSQVSPKFWIGKTGRKLRQYGPEAQVVAMYLLTSPHSNMLGVYYLPIAFIVHETGLPLEGASKGLRSCIEGEFCTYDHDSEHVWVHNMAAFQIGKNLSPRDNRVKGINKEFNALPNLPFLKEFFTFYAQHFHLSDERFLGSPFEAPSKTLRSQEQEQEQEQEQKQKNTSAKPSGEGSTLDESNRGPPGAVVIKLPTNRYNTIGEQFLVTEDLVAEWVQAYPAVCVVDQLQAIRAWCISNTAKRKTLGGMPRFINAWLAKHQDRGGGADDKTKPGGAAGVRDTRDISLAENLTDRSWAS